MKAELAVIGGSGAYNLLAAGWLGREIGCLTLETPFGSSAPIHHFNLNDIEFLFLSRHGEKDYSMTASFVNYRANIYALKECGVQRILAWSGPGIINRSLQPGDFVIPNDIIDETRNRETTFFKNRGYGFIRQQHPFCPQMRQVLHDSVHSLSLPHNEEAVYVCTEGPRLESPAEIRKFRIIGADLVGMTLIPETFLARELEMCYAPVCYLTNYAEGVAKRDFKKGQLFEGMQNDAERSNVDKAVAQFPEIISKSFRDLYGSDPACDCRDAMLRYKNKGMVGQDWHDWIGDP